MPNAVKEAFLAQLRDRFGDFVKLPRSNSLLEIGQGDARVYVRYSKVHARGETFFGLRRDDLRQLKGFNAFIAFLWDGQVEPLFLPFASYEDVFEEFEPAGDEQFKAQVFTRGDAVELYVARAGRFNLEGLFGWSVLSAAVAPDRLLTIPVLNHSQVQSAVAAIGSASGYDIWLPAVDRSKVDQSYLRPITYRSALPAPLANVSEVLQEIDVVWLRPGSNEIIGMFEVEHSTPIYSALLRFNDVYLESGNASPMFRVVANEARRPLFVRQLNRPTFRASGLREVCSFLEYRNVYGWYQRVCGGKNE